MLNTVNLLFTVRETDVHIAVPLPNNGDDDVHHDQRYAHIAHLKAHRGPLLTGMTATVMRVATMSVTGNDGKKFVSN